MEISLLAQGAKERAAKVFTRQTAERVGYIAKNALWYNPFHRIPRPSEIVLDKPESQAAKTYKRELSDFHLFHLLNAGKYMGLIVGSFYTFPDNPNIALTLFGVGIPLLLIHGIRGYSLNDEHTKDVERAQELRKHEATRHAHVDFSMFPTGPKKTKPQDYSI